jgi:DNA-binding response OmpR family regulator
VGRATNQNSIRRVGGYEPGVDFLQKPFSTDELDTKIRVLLERNRALALTHLGVCPSG